MQVWGVTKLCGRWCHQSTEPNDSSISIGCWSRLASLPDFWAILYPSFTTINQLGQRLVSHCDWRDASGGNTTYRVRFRSLFAVLSPRSPILPTTTRTGHYSDVDIFSLVKKLKKLRWMPTGTPTELYISYERRGSPNVPHPSCPPISPALVLSPPPRVKVVIMIRQVAHWLRKEPSRCNPWAHSMDFLVGGTPTLPKYLKSDYIWWRVRAPRDTSPAPDSKRSMYMGARVWRLGVFDLFYHILGLVSCRGCTVKSFRVILITYPDHPFWISNPNTLLSVRFFALLNNIVIQPRVPSCHEPGSSVWKPGARIPDGAYPELKFSREFWMVHTRI